MDKIHLDEEKISIYAKIQNILCDLEPNSPDESIDNVINQVPPEFLNQKDDLMVICQLIAYYSRTQNSLKKVNAIKLIERIMDSLKTILKDESTFFWEIFGSHYYFKYWMYEEGLIKIEQIILAAEGDETGMIIEYFLPEIIKEKRELFEKELKFKYKKGISQESISEFKEIRSKYIKWLRESGDYNDPFYEEIEKNRLRLSIKRDDIDTFQKILSELNISIDSTIMESSIENFLRRPEKLTFLEFAIEFESIKIAKFLIMNDAKFNENMIYFAIQRNNYELIHILESKFAEKFKNEALQDSIAVWNHEVAEYALNNFEYNFLQEKNIECNNDLSILLINQAFASLNFMFLESVIIPFLKNNSNLVEKRFYEIALSTFSELSCFFVKPFLNFPGIDINCQIANMQITFLYKALNSANVKGVELLVNHPDFDVNGAAYLDLLPIQIACKMFSDIKIIKMLCNHPKIDINRRDSRYHTNALQISTCGGHFYAAEYIIYHFSDMEKNNDFYLLFYLCLTFRHLYSLKIILKYYLDKHNNLDGEQLIQNLHEHYLLQPDYSKEFENELRQIIFEITMVL